MLRNKDDVAISKHEEMCSIVNDYFRDIFVGSGTSLQFTDTDEHSVITTTQNKILTSELSFEELSIEIKQIHPDKSAGPDGFNPAFFQNF